MSPQDKLNTQHHGNQAIELLRRVSVHLTQSGNPQLEAQQNLARTLQTLIDIEVSRVG
jgi:hypothetical protein